MNSAVRKGLDNRLELHGVDWGDVGIRLAGYATWKARILQWRTGGADVLAGGKTPEDLAADAILKVLEGERAWDPSRGALLPYLEGVVDSLMSHLVASPDNRLQERWTESHDRVVDEPTVGDPAERIERLRAALGRDQESALLAIVDAIADRVDPRPQDIARYLGTTVADVNNCLKRLRRYAQRIVLDARGSRGDRHDG